MTVAYVHGRIRTIAPVGSTTPQEATAMVVDGARILAVGDEPGLRALIDAADSVVDLHGRMVMPGVHDAHTHLVSGLGQWEVSFPPGAGQQEIIAALQAWDGPLPTDAAGNEWLIGGRYWPEALGEGGSDRAFLDAAFPDRPVVLHDRSAHNVLVNSRALELAGIDRTSTDPRNGRLLRDADGRLTGELYEQARWPLFRVLGRHDDAVLTDAVRYAIDLNHRYGVTSVQDASSTAQLLRVLRALDGDDRLGLHVAGHLVWHEESFGMAAVGELDDLIDRHESLGSPHVDTRFVKLWLDGSPIPPYWTHSGVHEDNTVEEEKLLIPHADLVAALLRFDAMGLSAKIHCGGEGAVRRSLDAVEEVRRAHGPDGPRHELAHCGRVTDQDFDRFPALHVGVEMSPAVWHIPEHNVSEDFYFDRVIDAGAEMTLGTDWSISDSPNLFPALQGALDHGTHSMALRPAIEALTINGARAVGRADTRGSLEPGKSADFIALDRDLFTIPISEVGGAEVLLTVFEGRSVFTRDEL